MRVVPPQTNGEPRHQRAERRTRHSPAAAAHTAEKLRSQRRERSSQTPSPVTASGINDATGVSLSSSAEYLATLSYFLIFFWVTNRTNHLSLKVKDFTGFPRRSSQTLFICIYLDLLFEGLHLDLKLIFLNILN